MKYLLSIILAVTGLVLLAKNKSASVWLRGFFSRRFKESGGTDTFLGSVDPNKSINAFTYRIVVIFSGLFFLIMAFVATFGPIYTGSASQNGSMLEVQ